MELGHLKLADGTVVSVQASAFHYCTPRENAAPAYTHVEVASFGNPLPELAEYSEGLADPGDPIAVWVYPYTPAEKVEGLIASRGGLAEHLGKRILF